MRRYTVKLYFAEPGEAAVGERRFDVSINARRVLVDYDVIAEAGASPRDVVYAVER